MVRGGLLIPSPDLILRLPTVAANGTSRVSGLWPLGVPVGTESLFQVWIPDPGAPQGMGASNGLKAVAR